MLITTHYLLPNYTVFKLFVLYTNGFFIKINCQKIIIIILLKSIKFMIITQETKIICTCQPLVFIDARRLLKFVI